MNLLLNSRVNPKTSAYSYILGHFFLTRYQLQHQEQELLSVINAPNTLLGVIMSSLSNMLDHIWIIIGVNECYMLATGFICVTDTLQYIPNKIIFPTTTTEDCLLRSVVDILTILKSPPTTLTFLSYGDAAKNGINQISRLLQHLWGCPYNNFLPGTHPLSNPLRGKRGCQSR